MIQHKYDHTDPRSRTNGTNKDPRRQFNDQVDVTIELHDKLKSAEAYYFAIKSDYENACYLAKKMDATIMIEADRLRLHKYKKPRISPRPFSTQSHGL